MSSPGKYDTHHIFRVSSPRTAYTALCAFILKSALTDDKPELFEYTPPSMSDCEILLDEGKGRAYVVLTERSGDALVPLCRKLSQGSRCLLLQLKSARTSEELNLRVQAVLEVLTEANIRQFSCVGLQDSCVVVLQLALKQPKRIRTLVLIDAVTRPHPTALERLYDRIESYLPLGLPFRVRSKGAHFKPFVQRLRCPVLVVRTKEFSSYLENEFQALLSLLPTSWAIRWPTYPEPEGIIEAIEQFQDVPVKCPQKNLRKRASHVSP